MIDQLGVNILSICLEGFLYGNISVLCALTCAHAILITKELQLLHRLGLYSGIFAIYYLQCSSNKSRTRTSNIVFYALCFLYVLSTASFVCDLLLFTLVVSNNSICKNIVFIISCAVAYQHTTISNTNYHSAILACPFGPKHSNRLL